MKNVGNVRSEFLYYRKFTLDSSIFFRDLTFFGYRIHCTKVIRIKVLILLIFWALFL